MTGAALYCPQSPLRGVCRRMKTKPVVVLGGAVADVSVLGADASVFGRPSTPVEAVRLSPGGDAMNEACVLARLGSRVRLLTLLGEDPVGSLLRGHCQRLGIDLSCTAVRADIATSVNIVLVDTLGERRFLTVPGSSLRRLAPEHLRAGVEALTGAEIVSFASLFVSPCLGIPEMEELFSAVKAKGCTLCADMTRRKNGETRENLRSVLRWVDVLFANQEEAALLTGTADPERSARRLRESGAGTVIVKLGARGGYCAAPEGTFFFPACPAQRLVDTTGAGDTFAGAFLHALSRGGELRQCLRYAAAAASLCVEQVGCGSEALTPEAVTERMGEMPCEMDWTVLK